MNRKDTGIQGEKLARDYLIKKGYRILQTNYRCPRGEIDIVALHKDRLVFVEVRTKTSLTFGTPEESITRSKMKHLERAAQHYRQYHEHLPPTWQIDLIAVELDEHLHCKRLELIENALEEYGQY
ncbi:MAG: YraN family protein [Dehalococcoidales bacterium]|nr:YraN family protein [Dehalococcoidales bacterium]